MKTWLIRETDGDCANIIAVLDSNGSQSPSLEVLFRTFLETYGKSAHGTPILSAAGREKARRDLSLPEGYTDSLFVAWLKQVKGFADRPYTIFSFPD